MKLFLMCVAGSLMIYLGCRSKTAAPPKLGASKVLVVYVRPDGTKALDVLLKVVRDTIRIDSNGRKKIIASTLWGIAVIDSVRDAKGVPILDSTGKPSFQVRGYDRVPSEGIITDIANKNYDSLMAKDSLFFKRLN